MAEFPGPAVNAQIDAAAHADAAADAGAYGNKKKRLPPAAGSGKNFAVEGAVGVVFQKDGNVQLLRQALCHGVIPHGEVGGIDENAVFRIDAAGSTDADGRNRSLFRQGAAEGGDRRQNGVGAFGDGGSDRFGRENAAFFVHKAGFDGGPAQVDA